MPHLEEQLTTIVEKELSEAILPFLQKLTTKERKSLIPCLSRLADYYQKITQLDERTYGTRATSAQNRILDLAGLVVFPLKEFRKHSWGISVDRLKELLPWHIPSWLNTYYKENEGKQFNGFYHMDYEILMDWLEQGVLTVSPTPESIAHYLVTYMNAIDILLKREITLKEHIWYLFQYDCGQNWTDSRNGGQPYYSFRYLTEQGHLDRMRVLRESLLATNRNLNKNLCGWFAGMFSALQPSKEEQWALQAEMLSVLSCPHSRPVNILLGFFKNLCSHPRFQAEEFIGYTSPLFSSGVKAVIQNTLAILEKLAKERKELRTPACCAAAEGLMNADEAIQSKIAKLIQTYGDKDSDELKETLALYKDTMLSATKKELGDYLAQNHVPTDEVEPEETSSSQLSATEEPLPPLIREDNRIPEITSPEDLIFLASQVLDVNEVYHFELFASALIQWNSRIEAAHLPLWTPILQRACKLLLEGSSRAGLLDRLMAIFLIDYTRLLIQRFPQEDALKNLYEKMVQKDKELEGEWRYCNLHKLTVRKKEKKQPDYPVHRQLLCRALDLLESNRQELPLLSTPTHAPAYLDPAALIQRLKRYQQAKAEPDSIDLQIALSRVALDKATSALPLIRQELEGEYQRLLLFFFGEQDAVPQSPFDHPAWWMTAGLIKSPETVYPAFKHFPYSEGPREYLTGNFQWKTVYETRSYTDYTGKLVEWTCHDLTFDFPKGKNAKIVSKGAFDEHVVYHSCGSSPLLVEMFINTDYTMRNDLTRTLWLSPNAPETILVNCLRRAMSNPGFNEVTETVISQTTMEVFHQLRHTWHEMSYLLEATAMLVADKTSRLYAAEIWIDRVSRRDIDSARIGKILASHQCTGWGPLKRLTDLIQQQMINISPLHNRELEKLLTAMLAGLPEKPVKELKKLLEIYAELLSINQSRVEDERLLHLLEVWKKVANLKKAVANIPR